MTLSPRLHEQDWQLMHSKKNLSEWYMLRLVTALHTSSCGVQQCLGTHEQIGSSSTTQQQNAQNGRLPFVKTPSLLDIHKASNARATLYALFLRMQAHALHAK